MRTCAYCGKGPIKGKVFCSRECGWADKKTHKDGDVEVRYVRFGDGAESKPFPYRYIYVGAINRFVMEHRIVMEEKMGRPLKTTDLVLHLNKDTLDNRVENLRVFKSRSDLAMARLGHHFSEDNMFNEENMRSLDIIFGFSKIIMQPGGSPQNRSIAYGRKTIFPSNRKRKTDVNKYREDDELLGKLAKEPRGHMVDCYEKSPYFKKVKI